MGRSCGRESEEAPDEELIRRAARGDRDAYEAFFRRHAERVAKLCYVLLHGRAAAEDAVQETFVRGLEHLGSFRGDAQPRVWLISIALNVCRRHLRDERRREGRAPSWELEEARRPGVALRGVVTSAIRRETGRQLVLALGYLTPSQREVFVLRYTDGMDYETLAPMLHLTPEAARSLAYRAKRVLRERLPPGLASVLPE